MPRYGCDITKAPVTSGDLGSVAYRKCLSNGWKKRQVTLVVPHRNRHLCRPTLEGPMVATHGAKELGLCFHRHACQAGAKFSSIERVNRATCARAIGTNQQVVTWPTWDPWLKNRKTKTGHRVTDDVNVNLVYSTALMQRYSLSQFCCLGYCAAAHP